MLNSSKKTQRPKSSSKKSPAKAFSGSLFTHLSVPFKHSQPKASLPKYSEAFLPKNPLSKTSQVETSLSNPAKNKTSNSKPSDSLHSSKATSSQVFYKDASVLKFVFDLSLSTQLSSFLLNLKSKLPKKIQTGEIALFYECELLGLRRAYLKKKYFS